MNYCPKCGKEITTSAHTCFDLTPPSQPVLMGWMCPRCQKVHSPFVQTCDCPPYYNTFTSGDTKISGDINAES